MFIPAKPWQCRRRRKFDFRSIGVIHFFNIQNWAGLNRWFHRHFGFLIVDLTKYKTKLKEPMQTTRFSASLDKKLTGQYRRLFRNLGLLMLVIIAIATASVVYFDKRQVEDLSRKLITSTTATIVEQIMSFFKTADSNLRIAIEQMQMRPEQDDRIMQNLFFRLSPFLNQNQSASGIIVCEVAASNE